MTPDQCRAARGLLNWTQLQLSERASVGRKAVVFFEAGKPLGVVHVRAIRAALEAGGAILMDDPTKGVRFARKAA